MSCRSRFFKIALISFLTVICLLLVTRNRIAETSQLANIQSERSFSLNNQMMDSVNEGQESKAAEIEEAERQVGNVEDSQGEAEEAQGQMEDQPQSHAEEENTEVDDSLPGAYLKNNEPAPTNRSHCKYNYQLPYDLVYSSKDYLFPVGQGRNSSYRIIYNVTEAYRLDEVPQITYATHITANYANFIPELLKRWDGLLSVAAFVPDLDVAFLLEQINQFCYCEPEMHRVSVHIVTEKRLPFSKKDIYFDRPPNCLPQDSSMVPIFSDYDQTVIYPINVLRNAARTSALTKYVLLSDVELMPSKGLASGFLEMVGLLDTTSSNEVFPVPIFELTSDAVLPEDKADLIELLQNDDAMYFHKTTCEHCQKFLGIDQWMQGEGSDKIKPFKTVKRHYPFHRWEPIFIGTNLEPLYNEQLSWEGLQDKMTQSLEMCLQDYSFTILDNAFLCHWPGIKTVGNNEDWRASFIEENNKVYESIVRGFLGRYRDIPACKARFSAMMESEWEAAEGI